MHAFPFCLMVQLHSGLKNKEGSPTVIRQNFSAFINTLQFCNFSITFIRTSQGVIHSPLVIKQWYMLGRSLMVTLWQRLCNVLSVQVAAAVYSYKKGPRFLLKNDEGPTVALAASTHRMNRGKNFQKERSVSTSSVLIQQEVDSF